MLNRRNLFGASAALISSTAWAKTSNISLPEAAIMSSASTQPLNRADDGPDYNPSSP